VTNITRLLQEPADYQTTSGVGDSRASTTSKLFACRVTCPQGRTHGRDWWPARANMHAIALLRTLLRARTAPFQSRAIMVH